MNLTNYTVNTLEDINNSIEKKVAHQGAIVLYPDYEPLNKFL